MIQYATCDGQCVTALHDGHYGSTPIGATMPWEGDTAKVVPITVKPSPRRTVALVRALPTSRVEFKLTPVTYRPVAKRIWHRKVRRICIREIWAQLGD